MAYKTEETQVEKIATIKEPLTRDTDEECDQSTLFPLYMVSIC